MARFRLYPTTKQEDRLRLYCAQARYVWNVALEQLNYSTRERKMPGLCEQSAQLTEARREYDWLREVPTVVGQAALRDFRQACLDWWRGIHGRPTWRKIGRDEGFRVTDGHGIRIRKLNRKWSSAWIPGVGWVKFRRTHERFHEAKSFRVKLLPSGQWTIGFAVRESRVVPGPGTNTVIGVDRGVAITLAYSDGRKRQVPKPKTTRRHQQAVARAKPGSRRRERARLRYARVHRRNSARRRDFIEKCSTELARTADVIRVEDLDILEMSKSARERGAPSGFTIGQKTTLNRGIREAGWGLLVERLEGKAPGRVEKVDPRYTSQTCAVCKHVDRNSRKSQALFCCTACGYVAHADVNAAQNIAARRAVRRVAYGGVEARTIDELTA